MTMKISHDCRQLNRFIKLKERKIVKKALRESPLIANRKNVKKILKKIGEFKHPNSYIYLFLKTVTKSLTESEISEYSVQQAPIVEEKKKISQYTPNLYEICKYRISEYSVQQAPIVEEKKKISQYTLDIDGDKYRSLEFQIKQNKVKEKQ